MENADYTEMLSMKEKTKDIHYAEDVKANERGIGFQIRWKNT